VVFEEKAAENKRIVIAAAVDRRAVGVWRDDVRGHGLGQIATVLTGI
jgi:hypothetical protein